MDLPSLASFWKDSVTCFTEDTGSKLCSAIALGTVSGLLLLLAHAALSHERCRYQLESGREATTSLYSLLGNICSTIGAVLSRQLHLQVVIAALSAAMDAVSFIIQCIPICLCRNSKAERIKRARRRRRRQHLFQVCVLMMVTGGFLKVGLSNVEIEQTPVRRKLLQAIMENNSHILGYVLGILSFVIASTSKFPAFYRAYTKQLTRAQVFYGVFCSLAATCYASALLLYDISYGFIWRALPWLLSAILCAIMDLLIVLIHLCKKTAAIQGHKAFSPDTKSLLGKTTITFKDKSNMEKIHSSPQIKKNTKVTGTDCYLHVNSPSERKGPVLLNLFRTVNKECVLSSNCVQENNQDGSSNTSFDSSSVASSNLEWDFEEANITWCEPDAVKLKNGKFSSQEWQSIPLTNEH